MAENEFREILKTLEEGKDMYYACYCGNHDTHYRSIIERMVERKKDIYLNELNTKRSVFCAEDAFF